MTQDLLQILGFWFSKSFEFFTAVKIPGTNVTCAGMLLFIASATIGIKFLKKMFGGYNED